MKFKNSLFKYLKEEDVAMITIKKVELNLVEVKEGNWPLANVYNAVE